MATNKSNIPFTDEWKPDLTDNIFTHSKNIIIAPLDKYYHLEEGNDRINYFMVNPKKSYNSEDLRSHYCLYVNYFEKFFDPELEYFTNLAKNGSEQPTILEIIIVTNNVLATKAAIRSSP